MDDKNDQADFILEQQDSLLNAILRSFEELLEFSRRDPSINNKKVQEIINRIKYTSAIYEENKELYKNDSKKISIRSQSIFSEILSLHNIYANLEPEFSKLSESYKLKSALKNIIQDLPNNDRHIDILAQLKTKYDFVLLFRSEYIRQYYSIESEGKEYVTEHMSIKDFMKNGILESEVIGEKENLELENLGNGLWSFLAIQVAGFANLESLGKEKFKEYFIEYISKSSPELSALCAVRELRGQFESEKFSEKPKYADRNQRNISNNSMVGPVDFLKENYSKELKSGNIGAGTLQGKDRALYAALERHLSKLENKQTVQQFLDGFRAHGVVGSPIQRRYEAAATLLGASEEEAARFLHTLRPDRVPTRDAEQRVARSARSR